jgi:hypothetical protein
MLERDDPGRRFNDAGLISCGRSPGQPRVRGAGTNLGAAMARILLAPELLNNVAASMILEAAVTPKGAWLAGRTAGPDRWKCLP